MKDFLGQELAVGDHVVYVTHTRTSSWLSEGTVEKITACKVLVTGGGYKQPDKIVKRT